MPILYPASNRFKYARSANGFRERRRAIQTPPEDLFSPSLLFSAMEQGAWPAPSDLSALYQDAAGTTPVTAVEQPVGLMLDKSKGLTLGPELVVNGTFDTDTDWTKGVNWSIGGGVASRASDPNVTPLSQTAFPRAGWYLVSISIVSISVGGFQLRDAAGANIIEVATPGIRTVYWYSASAGLISAIARQNTVVTIDNISVRELPGNHASQTTATSRPVLSARVNLLTKTEQFDDGVWVKTACSVSANSATDPLGVNTADKLVESNTNAIHFLNAPVTGLVSWVSGVSYTFIIRCKKGERNFAQLFLPNSSFPDAGRAAAFNLDVGTVETVESGVTASITPTAGGFYVCSITATADSTTTTGAPGVVISSNGKINQSYLGDGTSGIYIWGASLVPANQADLPYQRVNTATDYDSDPTKFAKADSFDGVDDSLIAATGGGSTTKFFWCGAIQCKKVGAAQTLFSDTGTNTGYRVRINASNQFELSAGNGTAYTTVATAGTLAIGQRAVLTAWHDGTSLKVQIDNGTVATAAFVTATAGTAQFTMGKDNNAASSFFGGWLYENVYLKDDVPSDAEIVSTKQYMATAAGVTL